MSFNWLKPWESAIGGPGTPTGGEWLFGQQQGVETGTQPKWTPEQQQLMQQLSSWFGGFDFQSGEAYPDQLPGTGDIPSLGQTSLTGLEQWAQVMAAGGGVPGAPEMPGQVEAPGIPQAPTPAWATDEGGFENYYKKAISDPMMKQFEEEIIPGIRARAAPAYWGSERLESEREATGDLLRSLTRSRAELGREERALDVSRYQAEVGAELGFGGLGQQQYGTSVQQALGFGGLGLQQYGLGQQAAMMPGLAMIMGLQGADWEQQQTMTGQQSQYGDWLRQQGVPWQQVNAILSALGLEGIEPWAIGLPGTTGVVQDWSSSAISANPL